MQRLQARTRRITWSRRASLFLQLRGPALLGATRTFTPQIFFSPSVMNQFKPQLTTTLYSFLRCVIPGRYSLGFQGDLSSPDHVVLPYFCDSPGDASIVCHMDVPELIHMNVEHPIGGIYISLPCGSAPYNFKSRSRMIIFKSLSYFLLAFSSLSATVLKTEKRKLAIAKRDDILQVYVQKTDLSKSAIYSNITGHHLSFPRLSLSRCYGKLKG